MLSVYFDMEATGKSANEAHIIQIGAVTGDGLKFDRLCQSPISIPPASTKIHRITDKMVAGAPPVRVVIQTFLDWLKALSTEMGDTKQNGNNAAPGIRLVAYNGYKFDFPLLLWTMVRNGMPCKRCFREAGVVEFADPIQWAKRPEMDTSRFLLNKYGKPSFTQSDVHTVLFGKPYDDAHNALADTLALQKICSHDTFAAMDTSTAVNDFIVEWQTKHKLLTNAQRNAIRTYRPPTKNFFSTKRASTTPVNSPVKKRVVMTGSTQ